MAICKESRKSLMRSKKRLPDELCNASRTGENPAMRVLAGRHRDATLLPAVRCIECINLCLALGQLTRRGELLPAFSHGPWTSPSCTEGYPRHGTNERIRWGLCRSNSVAVATTTKLGHQAGRARLLAPTHGILQRSIHKVLRQVAGLVHA